MLHTKTFSPGQVDFWNNLTVHCLEALWSCDMDNIVILKLSHPNYATYDIRLISEKKKNVCNQVRATLVEMSKIMDCQRSTMPFGGYL